MQNSRREILIGIAGAGALAAGDDTPHAHMHEAQAAAEAPVAYVPQVLNAIELKTLGFLCDTIIPRTTTPGARDARVHEIIDENLVTRRAQKAIWTRGIAESNTVSRQMFQSAFADAGEGNQAAVMAELAAKSKFFEVLKNATVDAYYSTKEGLMTELEWDAAKPMAEFKGCTHPEHQV